MNNLPQVSIVTPVLNAEHFIESCLESVINQTYHFKEHIIIDGLSTDRTRDIVKYYADNFPHIKWISERDSGIYDAMNKGIELSTGDWLYFLGSDDIFFDNDVLQTVFYDGLYQKYDVIYGNVKFKISGAIYDGKFTSYKLIKKNICHQAIFFKRSLFDRFGKYEIKYKCVSDWVLNMQWFNSQSTRYKYIDSIIAIYNEDGYCFNNPDVIFSQEIPSLIDKYFPYFALYLFRKRNLRIIKKLIYLIYGYCE